MRPSIPASAARRWTMARTDTVLEPARVAGQPYRGAGTSAPPAIPAASSHARTRATVGPPMYCAVPSPSRSTTSSAAASETPEQAVGHDGEKGGVP